MTRNIVLLIGFPNGIARNRYEQMIVGVDNSSVGVVDNSYEFLVLHSRHDRDISDLHREFFHHMERCDFSDPHSIEQALLPYKDRLCAVTARSDSSIPFLIQTLPFLPSHLNVPSCDSLEASIDKSKMREKFYSLDPTITPGWIMLASCDEEDIAQVIEKLEFPLMVKPTGLAASSFVTKVHNEDELREALLHVFGGVSRAFTEKGRRNDVTVVVEEFMEGDVYSTDIYVSKEGVCTFAPFVEYRNRAKDDFSPYIRITPSDLSGEDEACAREVAEKGIRALGLTSISAHAELMKTSRGWKVVEIGPRVGGNRDKLYTYAYGFNHAANDLYTRIDGKKPRVVEKATYHSVVIFLSPDKEGLIEHVGGLDDVRALDSFKTLWMTQGPGDEFRFSKNGGKHVVKVTLVHRDKQVLERDLARVQDLVKIEVR